MKKKLKGRVNLASKEGQKLKGSSQFGVSAYYKENLNLKNGQILTILCKGSFMCMSDQLTDPMILAKSELSCFKLTIQHDG